MGTFKSWLIANLEIVFSFFLALIVLGAIMFGDFDAEYLTTIVGVSAIVFVIAFTCLKHGLIGFVVGCICSGILLVPAFLESGRAVLLIVFAVVAVIVGVLMAIYAYSNFDEVVSRRFMYRNSAVSVFEESWKYAFNRFFAGFILVWGLAMEIMVITNVDQIMAFYKNDEPIKKAEVVTSEKETIQIQSDLPSEKKRDLPSELSLVGSFAEGNHKEDVDMVLRLDKNGANKYKVRGFYHFQSQPANKRTALNGVWEKETGIITLSSSDGTERFELTYNEDNGALQGDWFKGDADNEQESSNDNNTTKLSFKATINNQ